jgi:hypothetical protein
MSESVQFWLDNKMSAGIKVAAISDQTLVVYREKFYVVEKDAAQTRGGKALRYSRSSLPTIWKKALKGENPDAEGLVVPADDALPTPTTARKERVRKEPALPPLPVQPVIPSPVAESPVPPVKAPASSGSPKKMSTKPVAQTTVSACCPECNFKHEFPLEKGRNGRPFIAACVKCKADFAVRYVPVTVYQAQVAGFR